MYFRVRNFEKFQHYTKRTPIWIKLYNRLLDDYEFGLLPDGTKWHLVGIFLLASRHQNRIPADSRWIAKRIGATSTIDLTLLKNAGFIEFEVDDASNTLAERYQDASKVLASREEREKRDNSKSLIPENCPSDDDKSKAWEYWRSKERTDLNLDDQAKAFRAHHTAHGKRMADWSSAWQTWYVNALKFNKMEKPNGHGRAKRPTAHDTFFAAAASIINESLNGSAKPGSGDGASEPTGGSLLPPGLHGSSGKIPH